MSKERGMDMAGGSARSCQAPLGIDFDFLIAPIHSTLQWPLVYGVISQVTEYRGKIQCCIDSGYTSQPCVRGPLVYASPIEDLSLTNTKRYAVMHIYARTPTTCKNIGSSAALQIDQLTIQARSQSICVCYIRSQQKVSRYFANHSLCFLCFLYFMEYYPATLRLTREQYRGWVHVEDLKCRGVCVQFTPQK